MAANLVCSNRYMGTNIPGKPRQALNYSAGLPMYKKTIWEVYDNGLRGFDLDKRPNDQQTEHGITEIKQTMEEIALKGAAPR